MDTKEEKIESGLEKEKSLSTEDTFEVLLPERKRPIGRYGRLHKEYLKINHPIVFEDLIRSNILWDYLAEINEQAEEKMKISSAVCPTSEVRKKAEEDVFTNLIFHFNPDR